MRHFAKHDETGKLIAVGTGKGGTEITKEMYDSLMAEIAEKAELVDKYHANQITLEDVPAKWRDEIQCRVAARIAAEQEREASDEEIIADMREALELLGVTVDA